MRELGNDLPAVGNEPVLGIPPKETKVGDGFVLGVIPSQSLATGTDRTLPGLSMRANIAEGGGQSWSSKALERSWLSARATGLKEWSASMIS